jgi:hypothetical protein
MEELAFLAWIDDWTQQWGEREYYYIRHEDLVYAISHGLCEVSVLNQKSLEGANGEYTFYKNVIKIRDKYYINDDRRIAGH